MPFINRFQKDKIARSRKIEESTLKNGLRHCIFNTVRDRYVGEWKANKKTGKGVMLTRNKDLYEGDFNNDYRHGFGVLAYHLPKYNVFSLTYRGDWKNGKMHGEGLRVYPGIGFYIGNFKKSKRSGYGQMWYDCGAFYDGDWVDDLREGLGLYVREDGNRYEGSWYKDLKHGTGRFYFLNTGQIQIGVWEKDFCVFSTMLNLPYRQTAKLPTVYPLLNNTLIHMDKIIAVEEVRALSGRKEICLESEISLPSFVST
ncbi:MORN repeat-containing protein 3-like [Diorhabda carinulata]|uniref:MORN repeat-containing protein 3-like n=1 Tax=Diorhabda carinulata TaxID=1163345 RepID=UPI0024E104A2|nr:MORN repeat-containing protein 3-like isoform X1 [Diorhabda sublineata]XP_057670614.1 MORN repeat-containing protein 3-like [Diorhabda carinulata]